MSRRTRKRLVSRLTTYLHHEHSPRLEMSAVLAATGLAGFLASAGLLHAGMERMWLRYPCAVVIGYGVFLGLIWNLIRIYRLGADDVLPGENEAANGSRTSHGLDLDIPDVPDPGGCLDVPGDEGCVVVAALAIVFCLAVVALYFVANAPVLLAELVLDSVLVGGLYRKLRRDDDCAWFLSALRNTIRPAAVVFLVLAILGFVFSMYAPEARSIGAVIEKLREEQGTEPD